MKNILIGCGQLTWQKMSEDNVLAEIAGAGYDGAPSAPRSGMTTEEILEVFSRHGLKPAPGYLGADFWNKAHEDNILEQARNYARFAHGAGNTELYVASNGFDRYTGKRGLNRAQVAGHVHPDDGMTAAEWSQFAQTLNAVGEITLAEGVQSCFHNHVGTVIETREEIDHLWELVDHNVVFMGPDTGHLAWGGVDVVKFCADYASAIKTMHIKDINPKVLAEGVGKEWAYKTFSDHGVFTELGTGMVDFPAVFKILEKAGFQGWLIVETDVTQQPTALLSAQISRKYLRSLGM